MGHKRFVGIISLGDVAVIQDSHYADTAAVERASAALTVLLNTGRAIADLGCVEQTLLIPLAARALACRLFPNQGFADPAAEAIAARLACDLTPFEADRDMLWGLIERSLVLDRLLHDFLNRHPDAQVLSLGSGLSTQFERVDNGQLHWVDVDLPEVAEDGCPRYTIEITKECYGADGVDTSDVCYGKGHFVHPPLNGTPKSLGGITFGVVVIG